MPFRTFSYSINRCRGTERGQRGRPGCPSPEVGRGARLGGQPKGPGHFFYRGSQTGILGTCDKSDISSLRNGGGDRRVLFCWGWGGPAKEIAGRPSLPRARRHKTTSPSRCSLVSGSETRGGRCPKPGNGRTRGEGPRAGWGRGATTFAAILSSPHFRLLFPDSPSLRRFFRASQGPERDRWRRTLLPLVRCECARPPPRASFRPRPPAPTGRACVLAADPLPSPTGAE